MTQQQFVGEYLDKKMKGNKLPYGMAWFNLINKHTDFAERKWARMQLKKSKPRGYSKQLKTGI